VRVGVRHKASPIANGVPERQTCLFLHEPKADPGP
jgi:hypothetical protein